MKIERFSCTNLEVLDRNKTDAESDTASMAKTVKELCENDILLGRGGKNNQFIGNEKLRNMARKYCQEYQRATKKVKSQISKKIVDKVRKLNPPGRFLRKCSGKPGEWEDVGDIIAKEKTSQVLRDAIQARKSFSDDGDRHVRKRNTLDTRQILKSPPQKVTKTPVQKSFAPSRQPLPVTQWRANLPLPYRAKDQAYSPAYSSVAHHVQAYGRVSMSDFGNALEDVPNFPNAPLPYHQYPVTPTSSGIAVSTARKRARYSEESPLLPGYHQYPYPTPIRNADPSSSSPHRPPVFSTPPNARDLPFSPPNSHQANPRRISIAQTVEKKHPVRRDTAQLKPPPPVYKPKVPPENRIADSQDLAALLNDEVLSDSSNQGDLMFQNSF